MCTQYLTFDNISSKLFFQWQLMLKKCNATKLLKHSTILPWHFMLFHLMCVYSLKPWAIKTEYSLQGWKFNCVLTTSKLHKATIDIRISIFWHNINLACYMNTIKSNRISIIQHIYRNKTKQMLTIFELYLGATLKHLMA